MFFENKGSGVSWLCSYNACGFTCGQTCICFCDGVMWKISKNIEIGKWNLPDPNVMSLNCWKKIVQRSSK